MDQAGKTKHTMHVRRVETWGYWQNSVTWTVMVDMREAGTVQSLGFWRVRLRCESTDLGLLEPFQIQTGKNSVATAYSDVLSLATGEKIALLHHNVLVMGIVNTLSVEYEAGHIEIVESVPYSGTSLLTLGLQREFEMHGSIEGSFATETLYGVTDIEAEYWVAPDKNLARVDACLASALVLVAGHVTPSKSAPRRAT